MADRQAEREGERETETESWHNEFLITLEFLICLSAQLQRKFAPAETVQILISVLYTHTHTYPLHVRVCVCVYPVKCSAFICLTIRQWACALIAFMGFLLPSVFAICEPP